MSPVLPRSRRLSVLSKFSQKKKLFCFGTAISMALTYLFQLILFGPTLAIASESELRKSRDEMGPSKWRIQ
ncbi:hypothetical protein ANCDUO_07125, partial [Ancylostoma duodenale]